MGKIKDFVSGKKDLTKEARQALNFVGRYLMVEAGPGTGKTLYLGCKAYKIISDGIDPKAVLLLTFTNSAKNKMKADLEKEESIEVDKIKISTLHSLASGLIRRFQDKSFFKEGFIPIPGVLVKKTIDFDLKEELGYRRVEDCRAMRRVVEKRKRGAKVSGSFDEKEFKKFSQAYDGLMKFYNTVTFTDLIKEAIRLIERHENIKEEFTEELKYVLVDEYQDLNPAEHNLIDLLIKPGAKLRVAGDGNQSICGYRDADPLEIDRFTKKFPGAQKIVFLKSFRCPIEILQIAQSFMRGVPTKSARKVKGKTGIKCLKTEEKEVKWIVDKIKEIAKSLELRGEKKEIFVLALEKTILKKIEEELSEACVPMEAWWKAESEIGGIIPYLDFLENKNDNFALRLCFENEKKIGRKKINQLRDLAKMENISLWEALLKAVNQQKFANWRSQFEGFIKEVAILEKDANSDNMAKLLKRIISRKKLQSSGELEEFLKEAKDLKSLKGLRKLLEERETRETLDFPSVEKGGAVALSTFNKAKGRDADIVFISGLGEKTFFRQLSAVDYEEKRRMLYVAMTRAREALYLSWSKKMEGKSGRCPIDFNNKPCCFIQDIPQAIIEEL